MIRLKTLLEQYSTPKTPKKVNKVNTTIVTKIADVIDLLFNFSDSPSISRNLNIERRGVAIYNQFADIVNRRIEYNKKHNLPLDTPTAEETQYRQRLFKSAPSFGYISDITQVFDIINNIEQGKQDDKDIEVLNRIKTDLKSKNPVDVANAKRVKQRLDARAELKAMALGLDAIDGLSKGYWIQSEFKPSKTNGKTTIYIRPSTLPTLTTKQFDTLYNLILKTKIGNTFPGGNSQLVKDRLSSIWRWNDGKSSLNIFSNDQLETLFGQMGVFKFGCGEQGGTSYISVYDLWDLAPDFYTILGNDGKQGGESASVDITQFLHSPEIYYRIKRPEAGKAIVPLNWNNYTKDGKVKNK